jgi:hypothetical protein
MRRSCSEVKDLDFVLTGERLLGVSREVEFPRITEGFSLKLSELDKELEIFRVPCFALDFVVPFFLPTELVDLDLSLDLGLGLDLDLDWDLDWDLDGDLGIEGSAELERCLPTLVRLPLFFDINNRSEISS